MNQTPPRQDIINPSPIVNSLFHFRTSKSSRAFTLLVACVAMPGASIFAQTYPTLPALPAAEPATHINVTSSPYKASTSASASANTAAFQSALNAAAGTPGGAVVDVPAGTYSVGSINLGSNTWLNVEAGATLKASESTSDYPVVVERWQGQDINCYRGLISAYGTALAPLTNVAIIGSGTIIGPSGGINNSRNSSSSPNTPIGPNTIEPRYCNGVYIPGVTSEASAIWNIHPTYCSDVTVSGVTTSGSSANSDGCDPDSCTRVLIEGCTFGSGDDDIAVKSGRGIAGATVNIPTSDTTIENCTFSNCGGSSGGVSFGSEISGGIERVLIENCTFKFTGSGQKAIYIKYAHGRGGFVNDITADTNTAACELLDIESNYSNQQYGYNGNGPLGGETVPAPASGMIGISQVNNIYIFNSTETGGTALDILGDPQKLVNNIVINGLKGSGTTAGTVANATNVTLTGISVGTVSKTNVIAGITASPNTVTVAPGSAAVYTVTVPAGLPAGAVSLSIVGTGVGNQLPAGTTASFSPSTLSSGAGSSTLTLATSGSSPAGTYSENIQAMDSAGTLAWTAAVTLIISGTPPPPQVAAPAFSIAGGPFTSAQTVTITSATGGATINYTTDGSTPSETNGTVYSGTAVSIAATTTLRAIAYLSGMTDSNITSATYTISSGGGQVAAPAFSVAGGTFTSAQTVSISSSTGGASVRYTTDGSTPSETAGTLYSSPVTISATATLQAIAYASGMTDSAITGATYTIGSAPVTLNFEAESISYTATGATASVQTDTNSSGGKWVELAATGSTGQYIDFTVTNVPAGTYQVEMEWKGNTSRGTLQLAVDGVNVGPALVQYSATQVYPTTLFGTVTFTTAGSHDIRLTVTGKNTSSSNYYLSADKFTLVGQ
jgi:hypothetical protein